MPRTVIHVHNFFWFRRVSSKLSCEERADASIIRSVVPRCCAAISLLSAATVRLTNISIHGILAAAVLRRRIRDCDSDRFPVKTLSRTHMHSPSRTDATGKFSAGVYILTHLITGSTVHVNGLGCDRVTSMDPTHGACLTVAGSRSGVAAYVTNSTMKNCQGSCLSAREYGDYIGALPAGGFTV